MQYFNKECFSNTVFGKIKKKKKTQAGLVL